MTSLPLVSPTPSQRLTTLLHATLFVLGFSAVFVVGFGGFATVLGQLFGSYKIYLAQIGGAVVILFGLATLRIVKIPWFYYDTRPQWQGRLGQGGYVTSVLMGVFFAAGWSPCIGATLSAILNLGLSQETSGQAIFLSSGYALGLGVPFLLMGLGMSQATAFVRRFRKHLRLMEIITGVFLIGMGVLMLTDSLTLIAIWAQRTGLYIDLSPKGQTAPTYLVAILGGLLSFFSPCVLPLVPAYLSYLGGQVLSQEQAKA